MKLLLMDKTDSSCLNRVYLKQTDLNNTDISILGPALEAKKCCLTSIRRS